MGRRTYQRLTAYHLESAIAAMHARALGPGRTDWHTIVALYDRLMAVCPSPVVALNRGELRRGRFEDAGAHFRAALAAARNPMERRFLERRIGACKGGAPSPDDDGRFWTGPSPRSKPTWKPEGAKPHPGQATPVPPSPQ